MRTIILSALFAAGIGLAGIGGANAAPASGLLNGLANGNSMLEEVQYRPHRYRNRQRCRSVQVCRRGPHGRRCHWERVCR